MCLDKVKFLYDPPKLEEVVAYKYFNKVNGNIEFPYKNFFQPKIGEWMNEEEYGYGTRITIVTDTGEEYPTGFHVYKYPQATSRWIGGIIVKYKVLVRGIIAEGTNAGGYTLVAKEMKILEKIN